MQYVMWTVAKHCSGIAAFYIVNRKKKVLIEQTKRIVVFTHSPNKCHNIFTKYLFAVVIGHSFIFYWFKRNWHLNNYENIVKFVVPV